MKVVLDATGFNSGLAPLVDHRPTPLFRVVDKPIIVHVIEFLAHHGLTKLDIILCHLPQLIEETLDEGVRWGVKITYHLTRDPNKPFAVLIPVAQGWKDSLMLLGRADVLLEFDPLKIKATGHNKPTFLYAPGDRWTGWALMSPDALDAVPLDAHYYSLPDAVPHQKLAAKAPAMDMSSYGAWQQANKDMLQRRMAQVAYPTTSRMVEPGIWLSRATTIHPTAVITPPVFVGDNCQILEGTSVGPNVVIENHCILDQNSLVENALVCQQSYVGRNLEIRDCVVDRDVLVNLSLDTAVRVDDQFILTSLAPPQFGQRLFGWVERFVALAVLAVCWPVILALGWLYGIKRTAVVCLPTPRKGNYTTTFELLTLERPRVAHVGRLWSWTYLLPTLLNVAKGDMHFVGIHPLTAIQFARLLPDWQKLYRRTKCGMITLVDVDYDEQPSASERIASETYYAAHQRVLFDLKILGRWLLRPFRRFFLDR